MKFLAIVFALVAALSLTQPAQAEVAPQCYNLYNSPGSCSTSTQFTVQKQIKNPATGQFVDNLPLDQGSVQPGSTVVFRITITNTKGLLIENFNLTDTLPDALTSVKTQKGNFNPANNTLSYYLDQLEPDASDSFEFEATVKASDDLSGGTPLCLANIVSVSASYDDVVDNVQFCISKNGQGSTSASESSNSGSSQAPASTSTSQPQASKGGKPVASPSTASKSPNTGPEMLALASLIPAALGGVYLRKKSS